MSQLNALIEEHCPNGVEYKGLGEVGTFVRGSGLQKKDFVDEGIGCIHYGQVYTDYGISATQPKSFVTAEFASNKRKVLPGDVFIATTSENDEDLGKAVAWLGNDALVASGDAYIYKHSLDAKYVAYFLNSTSFHEQKQRWITGTKVRRIAASALERIIIPVPPLPVQQEIVRKLDMFTQLEAELEAELEARKKQYSYYAGGLLEPKDGDRKFFLGQISKIVRGASPRPIRSFVTEDPTGTPWIKIGDVPDEGKYVTQTNQRINDDGVKKSRLIKPGDFILSNSMSFGRPYISKIAGCIHDGWLSISQFEETLIPDYLYYLLRSSPVQAQFSQRAGSSTVRNLNADIVKAVVVSVPSLEEQRRIVEILNNFDSLTNDLYSGLPAEIAARRKQYEYYRDKLLTFKELSV